MKAKSKHTFFGLTSRALMTTVAALLVLSCISALFNPARMWFMSLFGLLYFPLAAINLFLLVWAIQRRSKALFIPLTALLPSIFIMGLYFRFGNGSDLPEDTDVKIISYNVGRFASPTGKLKKMGKEQCRDSVLSFLKTQNADIICLQEFMARDEHSLQRTMRRSFPGYDVKYYGHSSGGGFYGNVTLSRFPMVGKGKINFEKSANLALFSDYNIRGTKIRIYNCHFESYAISIPRLIESILGGDRDRLTVAENKFKKSVSLRPRQVKAIIDDIALCPLPSIVAGDFNDTPLSYTYHCLARGRRDSFVRSGRGFGATYAYLRPLLRIDYILFPKDYEGVGHRIEKIRYSDHYPICTYIRTNEN